MATPGRSPPGTWRLLAPALIAWASVALAVTRPGSGLLVLGIAILVGATMVVLVVGQKSKRLQLWGSRGQSIVGVLLVTCAVLSLVGVRVTLAERARADPEFVSAATRGGSLGFDATLSSFPESKPAPFGDRYWVRVNAHMPGGDIPALLWLTESPPEGWGPGVRLELRGIPEAFAPGDSNAYGVRVLSIRSLGAEGSALRRTVTHVASKLRAGLSASARRVPSAELVPGLAVGDTSLVGEALDQAMLSSSLSHLTAVSGSNCALVTGAALWLLGRLRCSRRLRFALAAIALSCFVVLVGPDPSVQRAAIMAAVLLSSGFGGKRASALPALGLAMIVLLVADPWQSLQAGFALSVTATGGILLFATPIGRWLRKRARLPQLLALPVAVALSAQLSCGPLLLLLQPGIPAIGVIANVIAAPAAPLGTALGLTAALCTPLGAAVSDAIVNIASLPARWIASTAFLAADVPAGRWHWPDGWPGALMLTGCQFALLAAWALHRGFLSLPTRGGRPNHRVRPRQPWQSREPTPKVIRIVTATLLAGSIGVFVGVTVAWPAVDQFGTPNGWVVVACDVGQGDALLLRDPAAPEQIMLVDTGDDPNLLEKCLDRFGITRIALLVLTHDDRDHTGALSTIVDRVDSALISPTVNGTDTNDRGVIRQLAEAEVPYRIGQAGDERPAPLGGLSWQVLAPSTEHPTDSNGASLVMMVDAGGIRALLLADTGLDEQRALLSTFGAVAGSRLSADVLKAAHHGSRDQDPRLPAAVGASWALVSVGAENRYGHPAPETIADIKRVGTRVLRTDVQGSIALVPVEGGGLEPWVERGS